MERHTYKICELQPKEPGKRGRHRRVVVMDWYHVSSEDLAQLRRMCEPRLQPNQVVELDNKIVARGTAVQEDLDGEEEEVDQDDTAADGDGHDAGDTAATSAAVEEAAIMDDEADAATNPVAATKFSIRMLWMAQKRHAVASEELCTRTSALTDKTLEQWKKVDDALTEITALRRELMKERTAEQAKTAVGVSMQDVMEIMRTGATIWREVNGPPRGGGTSES